MSVTPAGHRVLVLPDIVEEKTSGGIILAPSAMDKEKAATVTGVIIEVGMNAWKAFDDGTPWAKEGDKVYFKQYAGYVLKKDGKEYRVLNDEDVIAIDKQEA
jgi:chaperonin GroES